MNAPARLTLFGLALVAIFALTFVGARTVAPWSSPSTSSGHDETASGHDHGEADAGHDHGEQSQASPTGAGVRGLSVESDGYRIAAVSAPGSVASSGRLAFELTDPDGRPVTGYDENHEKDLHLVVVRSDGSHFRHVHPSTDGNGGWSIPWRWAAAGTYRIFADFVPSALGQNLTLTSAVQVTGPVAADGVPEAADAVQVDGFRVRRDGAFSTGHESTLTFTITRGGRPVTTLQPYLGAYGHLVALRSGDLAYLHVHPMGDPGTAEPGPAIAFVAEAPTDGDYLLYLDFQVDGVVHTAAFTVTAAS